MATRVVKDPAVRRSEILDVAQRLFYQKGYEQSSIQDVISEIGIAKGTFYYYFNSKLDLLDAVIERMVEQTLQSLELLVADDQLSALEKLERFFSDGDTRRIPQQFSARLRRILARLHGAENIRDMDAPGLMLHPLRGNLEGFWAVRVSGNWRVVFRFEEGNVFDVALLDYH